MVALIAQDIRNNLNIDTFDRLVVFCLYLLRKAYTNSSNDNQVKAYFEITESTTVVNQKVLGFFTGVAKFDLNDSHLSNGGNKLTAIKESVNTSVTYSGDPLNATTDTENTIAITSDISSINSLEKLLYWAIQKLLEGNLAVNNSLVKITTRLTGVNSENQISITFNTYFNYEHYLATNNLIEAIGLIESETNDGDNDQSTQQSSFQGNDSFFGNGNFEGN